MALEDTAKEYTSVQTVKAVHIEKKGTCAIYGTKIEITADDMFVFQLDGQVYVMPGERFRRRFQSSPQERPQDFRALRDCVSVIKGDSEINECYYEVHVANRRIWDKGGLRSVVPDEAQAVAENIRNDLVRAAMRQS